MARPTQLLFVVALCLTTGACALMPRELNLTPLWFHRLDGDGNVLEWDCLWPVLHYERTPAGGDDFRIRPLYRRVTEPVPELPEDDAVEHQFLWPLGRVRSYPQDTSARLFPLWSWRRRIDDEGDVDVDWYLLFPFVWGGSSADGREDYFAVFPLYADIPQFLTYDRFQAILFPLWLRLDKSGHRHYQVLWPFVGWSSCAEGAHSWFKLLPLYGHDIEQGRYDRRYALWPFFAWSTENLDARSGPVDSFWLWPFLGWRSGPEVSGWMALWPFFQSTSKQDHFFVLTLFWPVFRYYWNRNLEDVEGDDFTQWWVWPLVGRTHGAVQRAWWFLWPLIWLREYDDPGSHTEQQFVLPFYSNVAIEQQDGAREDYTQLWPLAHRGLERDPDGVTQRGDWSLLSPIPWRGGNAYGVEEAYGFLWQLARGRQRAPDDHAVDVVGRLYTHRDRSDGASASVPLLFNYERDATGARTLRLLQFLPIPLGGGDGGP